VGTNGAVPEATVGFELEEVYIHCRFEAPEAVSVKLLEGKTLIGSMEAV